MARMIDISGPAPAVDLAARNYTAEMAAAGCLSWSALMPPHITVASGRITAVAPLVGVHGLAKTADSEGPRVADAASRPGGKMVDDTRCYLWCPAPINEATFTLGMVWHLDGYQATAQDLFSIYAGGNSVRIWQSAGKMAARAGATDIVAGTTVWAAPGPMLSILSASGGTMRMRTRSLATTGPILTGARTPGLGTNCRAVFGADEINDGAIGGAPSAPRAMRDTLYDALVFDRDILAGSDPALAILDAYFTEAFDG